MESPSGAYGTKSRKPIGIAHAPPKDLTVVSLTHSWTWSVEAPGPCDLAPYPTRRYDSTVRTGVPRAVLCGSLLDSLCAGAAVYQAFEVLGLVECGGSDTARLCAVRVPGVRGMGSDSRPLRRCGEGEGGERMDNGPARQ